MSVARILKDDREKMGEQPMYRPTPGHGQSKPQIAQTGTAGRARRGEDPLAELARLIGQEDPFKEFDPAPRRAPANGASQAAAPRPERRPERMPNGQGAAPLPRAVEVQRPIEAPRPSPAARPVQNNAAPASRTPLRAEPSAQTRPMRAPVQSRPATPVYEEQVRQPVPQARPVARDAGVRPLERTNPRLPSEAAVPAYRQPEQEQPVRRGYAPEQTPSRLRRPAPAPAYREEPAYEDDYDPDYDDDAYLGDHADEIYDDVEKPRRGIGFWIVGGIVAASLVAVAFLGVFAYRTIFNTPQRAALVTKSDAPTKVEPQKTQTATTPASNKPIQDRLGAATQTLNREEQPLDLTQPNQPQQAIPDAARPQQQVPVQPRTQPAFTPPAQQQPPQQTQQQPQIPANADQPKRVKTYTVRSDGTVAPNAPAQQNNNAPLPLNAAPEPDSQTLPPQTRPISAVPAPQNRTVTAALSPSLPPVQQHTATGNYVVQVASHKTPDEAQTAWQNLRQQYASIFGSRNADIRKVNLGDRGTFYRAMVGPMSRDQANALCQNLKTQGAGCIVQTR